MSRYTFTIPITGAVEVTVDGNSPEEALQNYINSKGYTDIDLTVDYCENFDEAVAVGHFKDNGKFEEL